MKKILIVGGCGALIVLVLGAATESKHNDAVYKAFEVPQAKCSESSDPQADQGCLEKGAGNDARSELFLRPLRKKERRVMA